MAASTPVGELPTPGDGPTSSFAQKTSTTIALDYGPQPASPPYANNSYISGSSTDNGGADPVKALDGHWVGTINVTDDSIMGNFHTKYSYVLNLQMDIGVPGDPAYFSGTGQIVYTKPVFEPLPIIAAYAPKTDLALVVPSASVSFDGVVRTDQIQWGNWAGGSKKPYRVLVAGTENESMEGQQIECVARITEASDNHFSITQIPGVSTINLGRGEVIKNTVTGSFSRIGSSSGSSAPTAPHPVPWPWKLLGPLLAALMLAGASMKFDWGLDDLFPLLGSVASSFESLQNTALSTLGELGKSTGFLGAAALAAYDLTRLYRQGSLDGESTTETATKMGVSLATTVGGFIIGSAITDVALGALPAASAAMGPAGYAFLAAGLATALTLAGKGVSIVTQFGINTVNGLFASGK